VIKLTGLYHKKEKENKNSNFISKPFLGHFETRNPLHINWYKISLPALHSSTGHGSSSQQPNKRSGHSTVNETANWFLAQSSKDYKVV